MHRARDYLPEALVPTKEGFFVDHYQKAVSDIGNDCIHFEVGVRKTKQSTEFVVSEGLFAKTFASRML